MNSAVPTPCDRTRQTDFLSVLRHRLIEFPIFEGRVSRGGPCPQCQAATFVYYKDLGAVDYYENTWRVCTHCDWPGEHREEYSSGVH